MRDRINFFRSERDQHFKSSDLSFANLQAKLEDQETNEGRVTIIPIQRNNDEEQMKKFLKDAHLIRERVQAIESLVSDIRGYHGKITGSAARNEEVHQRLNKAVEEIRKLFDVVKGSLKDMEEEEKTLSKNHSDLKHRTADIRIMSSQYSTLQCWFFETWTEYNECQSDYREKCKEKLTRQIQITEKKVTPAQVNEMIETGNFTVFSYNAQFQPKDIEELESRHNDIQKLANSLKQLHEMFKDLALMVEQQGEMLNNIEKNVEDAREYVAQAERVLVETREIVDKTRKRKFICAIVISAIIIIIVVVIAVTIKLQS